MRTFRDRGKLFHFYFRLCYWLAGVYPGGSSALKGMDDTMDYLRSARGPSDLGNGITGMRTSIGMESVFVHILGILGNEIKVGI